MRWYQGGIAEAVSASKKSGAVFVVYVEGKDDKSKQLTELLNSEEISRQLEKEHFVAIKVEENSVPHQQFSQIYKQATVPSVFFIGKSGTPLAIVTEPNSAEEFSSKLGTILQSNGTNITAEPSTNLIKSEQSSEVACEDAIKPSTSKPASPEQPVKADAEDDFSPDDKVERAKEILNQKRETKRAEEEENARAKELERRKVGQDVQKLKRWQQDNELKELMDLRNKEKKEQQEARQRVLSQIAQDKAERAARFAPPAQPPANAPASPQLSHRVTDANTARLQFKLPDGSSHMHEFASGDTLQDVRNYILTNLNLLFHNFTLSTTFPRREFTEADCGETLRALQLVPNAVLLILPLYHGAVATNSSSWLMSMFWSVIGPILNFVGYLKSKLFGLPPPRSPTPAAKRPNETAGESSNAVKKRLGEEGVVRRQGNVHRLNDKADSDDDNNTWNGNSTQQM